MTNPKATHDAVTLDSIVRGFDQEKRPQIFTIKDP
jgi:hypothetical protein